MIVVPSVIKANKPKTEQFFNISRFGVYHTDDLISVTCFFPIYQE